MLNIDNIDLTKQYNSVQDEIKAVKSYIFQLYIELGYRLDKLEALIKEQEENEKG